MDRVHGFGLPLRLGLALGFAPMFGFGLTREFSPTISLILIFFGFCIDSTLGIALTFNRVLI